MSSTSPWAGLDDIYRELTPAAIRLAFLITSDIGEAEDAVHDAFLRVAERHRDILNTESAQAYLNKAVIREISSHRRRLVARFNRHLKVNTMSSPPPDEHAQTEHRLMLLNCLSDLPVKNRTVIVLTYFADYTDQQISDITTWPIGTIKSLRSRGLASLRKEISGAITT